MVGREYQAPSSSSPVSPTLKQEGTRGAQPRVAGRAEVALRDPLLLEVCTWPAGSLHTTWHSTGVGGSHAL